MKKYKSLASVLALSMVAGSLAGWCKCCKVFISKRADDGKHILPA